MDDATMLHFLDYVSTHLTKAFTAVTQPDSFLFWPYLVSAALLAFVVIAYSASATETQSRFESFRRQFNPRIWWHRSARGDYQLYFANALLLPALFAFVTFGDAHVVRAVNNAFGTAQPEVSGDLDSASLAVRLAFTLVFFVAYDFGRFVAHSLLHDVPLLWEFHKVHHSAEILNPLTTFRAHPIDLLVMIWVPVFMTGTVTWLFNHAVPGPISFYTYLGVHVILFASNLIGTLRHTHVWLSYGPLLNKWLISPAQHQLHHSCEPQHVGCNRGFELALWDRLYGTLYVPTCRESFRVGLGDGTDGQWHSLGRMYLAPFANAIRRVRADLRQQPLSSAPLPSVRAEE
jgi:sterol desaturase/sphingolipid hydroxylase (fatty acid hydroxylase superfamily)